MRMKYQHTAPVLDCAFYVGHCFFISSIFFMSKTKRLEQIGDVYLLTCRTQHILGVEV